MTQLGLGVCTCKRPEMAQRWAKRIQQFRGRGVDLAVISSADDRPLDLHRYEVEVIYGENLGVAHTKNRALRYLMERGADIIVLAEDDCLISDAVLFERFREAARQGIHHLMLGPVTEHATWVYTGATKQVGSLTFHGYQRTRGPQDTPGVLATVTREAVDRCGGLDARFLGRGHAHGEWTRRLMTLPGPLPSPFWLMQSDECVEYFDLPSEANPDWEQIKRNAELREKLEKKPEIPNLDYISTEPADYPISVCMSLMNRANTLRPCLDSIARWFERDRHPNELVIADFGSDDCDPAEEMKQRGIRGRVVRLEGHFSRARGLHRAQEAARHRLLMFLDADMLVPENFGDILRRYIGEGHALFPVCWSLNRAGDSGYWRDTGFGMVALHADDYDRIGGWNLQRRRWGGEDNDLHWNAERALTVRRACISGLIHQYHQTSPDFTERYMDKDSESCRGNWRPPSDGGKIMELKVRVPTEMLLSSLRDWGFHLETTKQFADNAEIPAEETAYYRGVLEYKAKGGHLWPEIPQEGGEEKIRQRLERFRRLFLSMTAVGYDEGQPITVAIDKRGEFAIVDGHHRAACTWQLGIEEVPCSVRTRAPEWVELRDALYECYREQKLYTPIPHPDFQRWKVARDAGIRARTILARMVPGESVLDVGCCTGGIALAMANLAGLGVTAVEKEPRYLRAAKAVERRMFPQGPVTWIQGDAFEMSVLQHDWVLCLSVLHHVAKGRSIEPELEWLKKHAKQGVFIEMADAAESQMAGADVPTSQEDIGPWVEKLSGMKAEPVLKGVPEDKRRSASDRRWIWLLKK